MHHRVGITRLHLEEDAGKSLHEGFADSDTRTYVDFNRSGVPLVEIVTEPDLRSPRDAAAFFERLRAILVEIGTSDGNMEEGSLRCDANVSIRPAGSTALGTRTEIKNLNSFRFLQRALAARNRSPGRDCQRRRPGRARDAPVGPGGRADDRHARQRKRRTTTGTFPSPTCRRS